MQNILISNYSHNNKCALLAIVTYFHKLKLFSRLSVNIVQVLNLKLSLANAAKWFNIPLVFNFFVQHPYIQIFLNQFYSTLLQELQHA